MHACAHIYQNAHKDFRLYVHTQCAVFAEGRRGGVKGVLSVRETHREVGGGS